MRNPDAPPRPLRQSIQVARPVPAPKPVAPVEPFKLGMSYTTTTALAMCYIYKQI